MYLEMNQTIDSTNPIVTNDISLMNRIFLFTRFINATPEGKTW